MDTIVETDQFWVGHPNPNPVDPALFKCCHEGFHFTERYRRPTDLQRERIIDLSTGRWLGLQGSGLGGALVRMRSAGSAVRRRKPGSPRSSRLHSRLRHPRDAHLVLKRAAGTH